MNMIINVNKYGNGGKCVCMLWYTYAGIRITNIQIEKGDINRSRLMRTSRAPWQSYVLNTQKKKKENKNWLWIQTPTQTTQRSQHRWNDRQRRKHTHTTQIHKNRQTDKECAWRRPRLLLVKRQGWGFTLRSAHVTVRLVRTDPWEKYFGKTMLQSLLTCRVEGVSVW